MNLFKIIVTYFFWKIIIERNIKSLRRLKNFLNEECVFNVFIL